MEIRKSFSTFVDMKKILLVLLLLVSMNLMGQKLIRSPYEVGMDSISASRLTSSLRGYIKKSNDVIGFRPSKWVKFTLSTGTNQNYYNKLLASAEKEGDGLGMLYLGFFRYDMRMKVYVSDRVSIINRVLVIGLNTKQYFYTSGLLIKF